MLPTDKNPTWDLTRRLTLLTASGDAFFSSKSVMISVWPCCAAECLKEPGKNVVRLHRLKPEMKRNLTALTSMTYRGVYPEEVVLWTSAPCWSKYRTMADCPKCEAMCRLVYPEFVLASTRALELISAMAAGTRSSCAARWSPHSPFYNQMHDKVR